MISHFKPYGSYCKYIGNLAIHLLKWTSIYQCNPKSYMKCQWYSISFAVDSANLTQMSLFNGNLVKFQSNVPFGTFSSEQAVGWGKFCNLFSKSITTFLMPANSIISCVDMWKFDAKRCIAFCRKTCPYHKMGLLLNIIPIIGYTEHEHG